MIEYFIYIIITAGTLLGTFLILHLHKRIRGVHVEVGIIRSQLQFYMQSLEARCDCIQDEYSSLNDKIKEYSLKVSKIQGYLIEIENSIKQLEKTSIKLGTELKTTITVLSKESLKLHEDLQREHLALKKTLNDEVTTINLAFETSTNTITSLQNKITAHEKKAKTHADSISKIIPSIELLRSRVSEESSKIHEQISAHHDSQGSIAKDLQELTVAVGVDHSRLEALDVGVESLSLVVNSSVEEIQNTKFSIDGLNIPDLSAKTEDLQRKVETLQDGAQLNKFCESLSRHGIVVPNITLKKDILEQAHWIEGISRKENFRNNIIFQSFDRKLSALDLRQIEDDWLPVLKLKTLNRRTLGYIAHEICLVEDRCKGRYATNIQDALIRTLVVKSLALRGDVKVLEIGALFGINISCLWNVFIGGNTKFHASVIDPLDGYYGGDNLDKITNLPVNEKLFWHNLSQVDCPNNSIRLIKKLSTDVEALKTASDRTYNYIIIDGDHSFDGIKNDFEKYSSLLDNDGYLLVDDYNASEWPDVSDFVDNHLIKDDRFVKVGNSWRTIVFQKIKH